MKEETEKKETKTEAKIKPLCPECGGSGMIGEETCKKCNGHGRI